jgi:hypothetical protein
MKLNLQLENIKIVSTRLIEYSKYHCLKTTLFNLYKDTQNLYIKYQSYLGHDHKWINIHQEKDPF